MVSLANKYAGQRLTLRMTVADRTARGYYAQWVIRANGAEYLMSADYRRKEPRVEFHRINEPQARVQASLASGRSCQAVSFTPSGNRLTASIASRCFGNDGSVRVAGAVFTTTRGASRIVVDDSRQRGYEPDVPLAFGPLLRRS